MQFIIKPQKILSYYGYLKHSRRGYKYITREGLKYQEFIRNEIAKIMHENDWSLMEGELQLDINYHFKGGRRRDLDNCDKVLFDVMTGIVYKDDAQIFCRNGYKRMYCDEEIIFMKFTAYQYSA